MTIATRACQCLWVSLQRIAKFLVTSGVLLKMEVGIRKGAWQRDGRYPAYLWSLRWVYAVKKTQRLVGYTPYTRVYPQYTTACNLLLRSIPIRSWLKERLIRSSAIAEGPRDASCQLKSCQLPRNSAETKLTYTTSPDQTDGMKLEVELDAMCHKQTDDGRVVYITCIPTTCCCGIF